jgi:hypothetical protein
MRRDAAVFTVTSQARFSFSPLLLRWGTVSGCYRLGRPGGNGLATLQLLARWYSGPFRNSFSAGIDKKDHDKSSRLKRK